MSEIEVKVTCPLGHTCEKVADGHIERCAWYIRMQGRNPQTDEPMDEFRCSLAWQPLLAVETNRNLCGAHSAIVSMREENTKRQELALKELKDAQGSIVHK